MTVNYGVQYTTTPRSLSSITHSGITWTFDRSYVVSRFADGSYAVIGDDVVVSSVSPAPTGSGSSYRNGSMINPIPGTDVGTDFVGYDGRHPAYNSSVQVTFPVTLHPGDSLVSTYSLTGDTGYLDIVDENTDHQTYCKTAAILTCLEDAPTELYFRPSHAGSVKTLYPASDIDLSVLPSLALPGSAPTIEASADIFIRPWVDHHRNLMARYMRPADNMPNYGRDISTAIGDAALLLCGDFTQAQKRRLAYGMVQVGIDRYHYSLLNQDMWEVAGGQTSGNKFMLLFAAKMLGHLDDWTLTGFVSGEDDNTYYGSTYSETLWTGWAAQALPYPNTGSNNVLYRHEPTLDNFGNPWRHEGKTLANWKNSPFPNNADVTAYPWDRQEEYRRLITAALPGPMLAARILGLKTSWAHNPLFDYVDRWMAESDGPNRTAMAARAVTDSWNTLDPGINWTLAASWSPSGGASYSAFTNEMWSTYRSSY